jgi:hypothetical protein
MNRTERIRERAYLLWERGDRSKDESHYWFQAEREIDTDGGVPKKRTRAAAPKAAPDAAKTPASKAAKSKPGKTKRDATAKTKPKSKPKPKAKETFPSKP